MSEQEILKKCRNYNDSNDILYYLIHNKQHDTYAIVYAPCNYLFKNEENQFFGICIYVSDNNISPAMSKSFVYHKEMFGIPMTKTTKKLDGDHEAILDSRQIQNLP